MISRYIVLSAALFTSVVYAGDSTLDAAIGGGIGGAAGAAIGNEVGGREGAVVGGALGAAVGAAVATDPEPRRASSSDETGQQHRDHSHTQPVQQFCPPGQAKKGRC